jgi:hypothetical protein
MTDQGYELRRAAMSADERERVDRAADFLEGRIDSEGNEVGLSRQAGPRPDADIDRDVDGDEIHDWLFELEIEDAERRRAAAERPKAYDTLSELAKRERELLSSDRDLTGRGTRD